jgi:hypothetical protein
MFKGISKISHLTNLTPCYALAFSRALHYVPFPVKVNNNVHALLIKTTKFENPAKDKADLIQALNDSKLSGTKVFGVNLIPTVYRIEIHNGKKFYRVCGNPHISMGIFNRSSDGFTIIANTGISKGMAPGEKRFLTDYALANDGTPIIGENYCMPVNIHSDGHVERSFYAYGDGGVGKFKAHRVFAFTDLNWTTIDPHRLSILMEKIRLVLRNGGASNSLDDVGIRILEDELKEYCRQNKNCVTFSAKVSAGIFNLKRGTETQEGFKKIILKTIKSVEPKWQMNFRDAYVKAFAASGALKGAVLYTKPKCNINNLHSFEPNK